MADKSDIIDAIEALAVHCRPPLMSVEQRTLWMRDWCADLADFPLEAIGNACRRWRHSESTKFPTAGQLLPLVRDSLPRPPAERVEVWRPASPDEYRAMTVREKIREHTILAHEAYSRAGPMFRNNSVGGSLSRASGTHLTPDEMPPTHAQWIAEGARHSAEVKRLRELINRPQAAQRQSA